MRRRKEGQSREGGSAILHWGFSEYTHTARKYSGLNGTEFTEYNLLIMKTISMVRSSFEKGLGAFCGYFLVHHTEFQNGANLLVMIIGALFFVVYLPFGAGALFVHGFGFYYRSQAKKPGEEEEGVDAAVVSWGGIGWIGSWFFITGYVRLAGDL